MTEGILTLVYVAGGESEGEGGGGGGGGRRGIEVFTKCVDAGIVKKICDYLVRTCI